MIRTRLAVAGTLIAAARGVLHLLCWTFIPAVIALIEGIVYLAMSDAKFAAKYG